MKTEIQNLAELESWVRTHLSSLLKGRSQQKTIILLRGPLGAGKTSVVTALLAEFDSHDVASPSYALHHNYALESLSCSVDHWDLYRLSGEDDLESSGFWDQWIGDRYFVLIEWAERISVQQLPRDAKIFEVFIELKDSQRWIELKTV